jgi:hypothetical protein
MIAYGEESGTRKMDIPAEDRDFTISRPSYLIRSGQRTKCKGSILHGTNEGAVSATITE